MKFFKSITFKHQLIAALLLLLLYQSYIQSKTQEHKAILTAKPTSTQNMTQIVSGISKISITNSESESLRDQIQSSKIPPEQSHKVELNRRDFTSSEAAFDYLCADSLPYNLSRYTEAYRVSHFEGVHSWNIERSLRLWDQHLLDAYNARPTKMTTPLTMAVVMSGHVRTLACPEAQQAYREALWQPLTELGFQIHLFVYLGRRIQYTGPIIEGDFS